MGISSQASGGAVKVNYTFFIAYMVLLSAFGSFVNDMFVPSLPSMCKFFGCTVPMAQMGLSTGMMGLGVGQLILGPLSDHLGRKPVLYASTGLFFIAAIVSVFSPTIQFFLGCRFFQGMGAAGGYFLARTIPADVYGGRELAKAMALIGAINGLAPASAPVLGGIIAGAWTWKGVFVSLAVFAVILMAIGLRLKETLPPAQRKQDNIHVILANYKLLLKNRAFMTHALLKGAALGLLFGYVSSAPFIIQTRYGFSQTGFGIIMGINAIPVVLGSLFALRFKVFKRAALVGAIGLMAAAVIEGCMMWLTDSFWTYELSILPITFFLGMIFTVGNTLAMNEGRANAGTASAILGVAGYIFGAIVTPLVGLGDILHSASVAFIILAALTLGLAVRSWHLPADADMTAGN